MPSRAALEAPYEMCPGSATRLAWLETLTIDPPQPRRIIDRDAYLVTRRAPRVLMAITLSKTAMSVSIGVAISPPAGAIDDAVDVKAVQCVPNARFRCHIERQRTTLSAP